jgi:stage V sporulation protein G
LFVAMPSKRTPNGEFRDIAHPINAETREEIQHSVLEAYSKEVESTVSEV